MSTRGWYEYYIIDPVKQRMSLAMQFYKWGDATPDNALSEWQFLQDKVTQAQGQLPVIWLDDLLREQLHELYENLPEHFSVGAFLFLLQRASEELSPLVQERYSWRYSALPQQQHPDYRLGFAIGKAIVLNGFPWKKHPDRHLDMVLTFIAAGHFVRPWKHYGLRMSILQWLQYLTQPTLEIDMGSIAGDFTSPRFDTSFTYRFFVWLRPEALFEIDRLAVELCDRYGDDLLAQLRERNDQEYDPRWADDLDRSIETLNVDRYSLAEARQTFELAPDPFWELRSYERPELVRRDTQ